MKLERRAGGRHVQASVYQSSVLRTLPVGAPDGLHFLVADLTASKGFGRDSTIRASTASARSVAQSSWYISTGRLSTVRSLVHAATCHATCQEIARSYCTMRPRFQVCDRLKPSWSCLHFTCSSLSQGTRPKPMPSRHKRMKPTVTRNCHYLSSCALLGAWIGVIL